MFIPGETIAHLFHIPFTSEQINKIVVSYKQNNRIILKKEVLPGQLEPEDQTGLSSKFTVVLSQEESLLFDNDNEFTVQLNVIFTQRLNGVRSASVELKGSNGIQHIRKVVNANG